MKILIVDDHPVFIEGLKNLLSSHNFDVIGTANDGEEAILLADELQPDVIMMDINMSKINGIEATKEITEKSPEIKIIMLTSFEEDKTLFKAIKAGASGYLFKNIDSNYLIEKLNNLENGDNPFAPGTLDKILNEFKNVNDTPKHNAHQSLSEQQINIIKLIANGLTYAEAGSQLFVSERTIKYHISQIKEKIGANNKTDIIAYGLKNKLF